MRLEEAALGDLDASPTPPVIDIGIVTIRDDEFRAVLAAFAEEAGFFDGRRQYTLRRADAGGGRHYTLAILRQIEQGNGEAQSAAHDLIEELHPSLLLVVGIAGALPSDDISLGDVVLATRVLDLSVEARKFNEDPTYSLSGGPIDTALAARVANLAAREKELGDWTSPLGPMPALSWTGKGRLYGPKDWQADLRAKLKARFANPRGPRFADGPIASSDRLVKDPELLVPWIKTSRHLLAVEMESGGVYRAARDRCAMLAIRGISDIVGLRRADEWRKFACTSAAAFTAAFLRTQPVGPRSEAELVVTASDPAPQRQHTAGDLALSLHSGFKGRDDDLTRLHAALRGGSQVALHAGPVAAHGGGGIGKSRLATEYGHRYSDHYPGGVHFAVAGSRGMVATWADLARGMPKVLATDLTQDKPAAAAFARWLADPLSGQKLVILDDVQGNDANELAARFDPQRIGDVRIWPPDPATASVLMTTRLREIPGATSIEIRPLDKNAARDLLLDRAGRQSRSPDQAAAAMDLAHDVLGGHPLAISLAGSYLRQVGPGVPFTGYAAKVAEKGLIAALEEAAKVAGHRIRDHERSIVATYALSRSQLSETVESDTRAALILTAASLLEPAVAIDRRLIADPSRAR